MISLDAAHFPSSDRLVRALWSPVLFRPILGSPEQFVIGVAIAGEAGVHLERANQLGRLRCVFLDLASSAIIVAQTALDAFEADLAGRSVEALTKFRPVFSGVSIGDVREAEGSSLQQIGASWMAAMSSLYDRSAGLMLIPDMDRALAEVAEFRSSTDRLSALVLDYVIDKRPGLDRFFSAEIRDSQSNPMQRRRTRNAHGVIIDFAGSHLVANFGTLSPSAFTASVGKIKTRLWELKVDRDKEPPSNLVRRDHEMIVQHPRRNDPQLTQKQAERMDEALHALEAQADQEELRLRPLNTVEEIGQHILDKEAA